MSALGELNEILDRIGETARRERDELMGWLAAASDDDLVDRVYELVGSSDCPDEMYAVLTEVFERCMPDAEWRNVARSVAEEESDPRRELEALRVATLERAAARVVARCPIHERAAS